MLLEADLLACGDDAGTDAAVSSYCRQSWMLQVDLHSCCLQGKSGGALIQQFMIISFGSLAASTPYLGVILLFIVLAWMRAGASLSKQFTDLNIKEQKAKLMESQAATGLADAKFKFVSKVNEQVSSS